MVRKLTSHDDTTGALPVVVEGRVEQLAQVLLADLEIPSTPDAVGAQPADADLAAIAALTTTPYGRELLTLTGPAGLTALLGAATASVAGAVRLATASQAQAGTATDVVVTPAGLKAAIDVLYGGVPQADRDTILELGNLLTADGATLTAVTTALSGKASNSDLAALSTTTAAQVLAAFDPADVGYDIFLLGGQSNEAGSNADISPTYLDAPDDRVRQFPGSGGFQNQIVAAVEPLIHRAGATGVGHALTFAKIYRATIPGNRDVLLVCAAYGATGFTTSSLTAGVPAGYTGGFGGSWDPAAGSGGVDLLQAMIDQANAAVALSAKNRVVGMLWLQGEADAATLSQAQYAAKLDALITKVRGQVTGAADMPVVVSQMVPEGIAGPDAVTGRATINAAHIDTPRRVLRTGFTYGPVGYGTGTAAPAATHYTAAGQRVLGERVFRAFQRARANVLGVAPVAPTAVTLTQSGSNVAITWERPVGRYTAWLVETKIGTGAWTTLPITPTTNVDRTATTTGLSAGDQLQVKVSTVNEAGTSAPSAVASLTLVAVPAKVTGLTAGTAGGTSQPLSWTAVTGAVSYLVEYKPSSTSTWLAVAAVTGTIATVTGLGVNTAYDYRVSGLNAGGSGTASNTTTASTAVLAALLDDIGVAAFRAYSTRRLRTAYAGSAIRVRRTSDSTETDIGFDSNGNLDTATLLTFAGSGSAFVSKFYDQSGNGFDLSQTTTAAQPRIVNAGVLDVVNAKATLRFDGADDILLDTVAGHLGLYASTAGNTQASVTNIITGTVARTVAAEGGTGSQIYNMLGVNAFDGATSVTRSDDATVMLNASVNTPVVTGAHTRATVDDGVQVNRYLDGVKSGPFEYTTAKSAKTMTLTRFGIGGLFSIQFTQMLLGEYVAWTSVLPDDKQTIRAANQKAYWGTP